MATVQIRRGRELVAGVDVEDSDTSQNIYPIGMTRSAIADMLFIEMCDRGPIVTHPCTIERRCTGDCKRVDQQVNKYYYRAAKYAGRISAGDFSGRNANKNRPIFEIDLEDLSPQLQEQLRYAKESLDLIITEAAFKLFRARHKHIFFEHIQPQKLGWKLIGYF